LSLINYIGVIMKLQNHSAAAMRALAFMLLLGAALPIAAQTAARDPLAQPFAVDSIWNMPIGSGAQYVAINMSGTPSNNIWAGMPQIDDDYIIFKPAAPLTAINLSDAAWTGRDRCPPPAACSFRCRCGELRRAQCPEQQRGSVSAA